MSRTPGMIAEDRIAAVTTLSFDIHVLELLLPLTVGASIVIVDRDDASDGARLAKLMADAKVTIMQATPATWRMLVESGWEPSAGFKALSGGESLPPALAAELLSRTDQLWNMYGPTETTVWSTCERIQAADQISIGRPIANTRTYVLDRNMQPTPIGVPGELYIGGHGVTFGYLGRPKLTAERFVEDPFTDDGSSRLYRTGDLVSYREDGRLDYIRRLDEQVKVRGFRIELGEIETALAAHPAVRDVAVVIREPHPEDKRLVAYLAAPAALRPTVDELRAFLLQSLPDYMVPSVFVMLAELPMTPNRKVNKKALPKPDSVRPNLETSYAPPRDGTEKTIAAIWKDLLGIDTVGIDDNFFDLGGHSLLVMQMRTRLEDSFGREVPVLELFRHSSVSRLAAFLNSAVDDSLSLLQTARDRGVRQQGMLKKFRRASRA